MQEIQSLIQSLESYDSMHQQKWYFLKEACISNEYMIHPRIIAQNWLMSLCRVDVLPALKRRGFVRPCVHD